MESRHVNGHEGQALSLPDADEPGDSLPVIPFVA